MTTTLKQLLLEQSALEQKIQEMRLSQRAEAISSILALVADNGLTQLDIFPVKTSSKEGRMPSGKVVAKYRDPETGKEWSGRGLSPKWLVGKNKEDFLIAQV